jgi:hypothetical protein
MDDAVMQGQVRVRHRAVELRHRFNLASSQTHNYRALNSDGWQWQAMHADAVTTTTDEFNATNEQTQGKGTGLCVHAFRQSATASSSSSSFTTACDRSGAERERLQRSN